MNVTLTHLTTGEIRTVNAYNHGAVERAVFELASGRPGIHDDDVQEAAETIGDFLPTAISQPAAAPVVFADAMNFLSLDLDATGTCRWGGHPEGRRPAAIGTTPNGVPICAECAPLSGLSIDRYGY